MPNRSKITTMKETMNAVIEAGYPISFRKEDARVLGQHLKMRHSVVLVGMKRVGISNFLRFFLHHKKIVQTYIRDGGKHLFIPIDLNDLVERELSPFWTLTLKRIVDMVQNTTIAEKTKKQIETLFLDSIQSQDLFLTIDSVRRAIGLLVEDDMLPTIFFIRFDRLSDAVTPEFFANLQGIRDATHHKLCFVFTSVRPLTQLSPVTFTPAGLASFSYNVYVKPARWEDIQIVYESYRGRYELSLPKPLQNALFDLVDGYIQYLQLSLLALHEEKPTTRTKEGLFRFLVNDERITFQSEELWESLTEDERAILLLIARGKRITGAEEEKGKYLFDTGLLVKEALPAGRQGKKWRPFSSLFTHFLKAKEKEKLEENNVTDFTKKEYLLFSFLKDHEGQVCEREAIIESVWPQEQVLGVSDWAIDRLVARVRAKLKLQKASYEIQTVKTRGYKLVEVG